MYTLKWADLIDLKMTIYIAVACHLARLFNMICLSEIDWKFINGFKLNCVWLGSLFIIIVDVGAFHPKSVYKQRKWVDYNGNT